MTKDEALKLALEALGAYMSATDSEEDAKAHSLMAEAFFNIKEALAQPEQEPVAYPEGDVVGPCICGSWPGGKCLKCPRITTPPQRPWVGLTDEELSEVYNQADWAEYWDTENGWEYERAIEAKLKEKNGL